MNQIMSKIADATAHARLGGEFRRHMGNYSVYNDLRGTVTYVNYRGTDVVTFERLQGREQITLYTNGWFTPTTKNVMNAALAGTGYFVYQYNFVWYVDNLLNEENNPVAQFTLDKVYLTV